MSSNEERVFVIGANGDIASVVVRGLIKNGIDTTAYVRDEQKAKDLCKNELNTKHLSIVVSSYTSIDIYTKTIQGHTRLFLIISDIWEKPASMSEIKENFAKIAYENGVHQIVDISSIAVSTEGKVGTIAYAYATAEDKLLTLADEKSEQRSIVIIRLAAFMNNHLKSDFHHIKHSNKLVSCEFHSSAINWIDSKDISGCAVAILGELVLKHDRLIYKMSAETISNEHRATIFSKVLGRPITDDRIF